jgi:hypothetical protein
MTSFLIPESLNQEYESIKARFLAKGHIFSIKECESTVFLLSDQEKLEACGIMGCKAITYYADTYDQNAPGELRTAGRHIGVQTEVGRSSVILMRRDYPAEYSPESVVAYKVCTLYHELGHADDFYEGINFRHAETQIDAEAAEKYADAFARERLKRIKCEKIVDGKTWPATLWDLYNQQMPARKFSH